MRKLGLPLPERVPEESPEESRSKGEAVAMLPFLETRVLCFCLVTAGACKWECGAEFVVKAVKTFCLAFLIILFPT